METSDATPAPAPAAPLDAPSRPESAHIEALRFSGTGSEYFRIWIVNLLLTIVTLGIYSPWAKVRRLRYFYGSTTLAGSSFEYHARPIQILKGRLIAVAALVAYSAGTRLWPLSVLILFPLLMLAIPWVIVRSRRFQTRMSSWRNIRFGFHGTYGGAFAAYIGWGLLAVITFYLMLPLWLYHKAKFLIAGSSYGDTRIRFERTAGAYFALYYKVLGFSALTMVIVGVTFDVAKKLPGAGPALAIAALLGVLAMVIVLSAYYERSFVNATFDGVRIGPHTLRCRVRLGRLLYLYVTNIFAIIFTLGLYFPWALVRRLKYQIECMHVDAVGDLDQFVATAQPDASAVGEEIGDFFDLDFGF